MALLTSDAFELLRSVAAGQLSSVEATWSDGAAACIVMAAPGYPGEPERGVRISVPDALSEGTQVLYAGVTGHGTLGEPYVSAGGRVLNVVGTGQDLPAALQRV